MHFLYYNTKQQNKSHLTEDKRKRLWKPHNRNRRSKQLSASYGKLLEKVKLFGFDFSFSNLSIWFKWKQSLQRWTQGIILSKVLVHAAYAQCCCRRNGEGCWGTVLAGGTCIAVPCHGHKNTHFTLWKGQLHLISVCLHDSLSIMRNLTSLK